MSAPRPTRIEHVVDGARLRAQLTAAARDAPDPAAARARALDLLKGALFRGRMIAKDRLEEGAGGIETARLLARVTDEVVGALYDFTTVHVHRARNPTEGERLAVIAVGGYGRGTLAPFSDLDLLFLRRWKTSAHVESVVEYMLYALWDLGFKVGHASRTVEECLRLARDDMTIRTTLLEGRRLCGDAALSDELGKRFRKDVVEGTAAAFVAAKLAERDERHARAGASRYLVEPNVKEGKGGLRDLNTLYWIAQYLHPPPEPGGAVRLDAFTGAELKAFLRASDFLWAVRHHLHWAMGRADERLSFDVQPEIARRMGFGDRVRVNTETGGEPAVERFMRRYFLTAREVGSLTRTYCAKLEAEHAKPRSTGLSRFFPRGGAPKRTALGDGLHEEGGRLDVDGPQVFARDPVMLVRLFAEADRRDLDLHPDAFAAVTRSLGLIGPQLRRSPRAAEAFLQVLAHGRETLRTLTLMNESGVLGRYLPEWGRIVGQMQFNMYHSYTVDEHTLRAVGVIADIARGRHAAEHPLCAQVFPLIADAPALFLAMLLHDTGKGGEGGQERAGAVNARKAATRLGLAPERVERVGWLVENHLAMSDFAQKRDISDPSTIAAFAKLVQTPERLRMLLVLTVADIRAVGPGVWNGWKGQLLRELHTATEAVFRGGRAADPARHVREEQAARAALARDTLVDAARGHAAKPGSAQGGGMADAAAWAAGLEDAYFTAFSAAEHADHLALSRRAAVEGGAAACVELTPAGFAAEASVVARDRPGLFADLAGALAAAGAGVVGARIHTSQAGEALDVFLLQDVQGRAFGADAPGALKRLAAGLEAAARGGAPCEAPSRRVGSGRADAFAVAPTVVVDNAASDLATVVEVSGRDRPGLLEALGRAFSQAGLLVGSAHVETYGERAVDAFYVTEAGGAKLVDPDRIVALEQGLTDALASPELSSPRRLPRARASAAR